MGTSQGEEQHEDILRVSVLFLAACSANETFENDIFAEEMVQAWEQAIQPAESLETALVQKGRYFGDRWLTEWRKITGHRNGDYEYRAAVTAYKKKNFTSAQKHFEAAKNRYTGRAKCKGQYKRNCRVVTSKYCPKKCCRSKGGKTQLRSKCSRKEKKGKKAKKAKKAKKMALAALEEARIARSKAAP